ncbi:MAG: oxaloacetate decarboxylase, partial [Propionicimonas sp.]
PLVTPSSQIVGTQAVFNVLMGKYKVMTGEFADLMLGYYGECIGERNPEVIAIAQAQAKKDPITVRPADLIAPEWDKLVAEASKAEGFDGTDEDVLTYAMFPGVAPGFFAARAEGPKNVGKTAEQLKADADAASGAAKAVRGPIKYKVSLGGRDHSVSVEMA